MTRNVRTYNHFCLVARALERIGDRWSLLVVRDLLTSPKRFTDLERRLGGITPKTLTQRLRELADVGVVAADHEPGRREVRYRLTEAGHELEPVVDALAWWGLRHAWRWPQPGEALHVEHLLGAITQAIDHTSDDREPTRWYFRFPDDEYVMACDGKHWTLTAGSAPARPDVTITATTDSFAQFLFDRPGAQAIDIEGDEAAVRRFRRLINAFTDTVNQSIAD